MIIVRFFTFLLFLSMPLAAMQRAVTVGCVFAIAAVTAYCEYKLGQHAGGARLPSKK
jgi:hypothetical protein